MDTLESIPIGMILVNFNVMTAMKRFFAPIIALAMLTVGCAKEEMPNVTPEQTRTIGVVAEGDATRTYVDGETIKWHDSGEQLNIIYFADESTTRRQSATHEDYTVEDNRAMFTADFTTTDGALQYTFGAFYPYAYKSTTSTITLTSLTEQTPTADGYDPKGDILVSMEPVVTSGVPDQISFKFARMVAFAKMTLKGIGVGEKIEKVVFSSPAKPAGSVVVSVHQPATVDNAKWYNNYEDITLNMGGREATGEDTVWFTTMPTDLSGSEFTVTVTTDKQVYFKRVDLEGKSLCFERADVAVFTVKDLAIQEKPKAYKLLTDVAQLNVGDKVIISNRNNATTSAKHLSVNPYDATKIGFVSYMTVTDDLEILETSLTADVAIFTLEAGATPGTYAFKDASAGYLAGTYDDANWSSSLFYSPTLVAGASWTVELIEQGAKMGSSYNGSSVRYLNNYDNSKMNYANSRGTNNNYYIYYMDGEAGTGDAEQTTPLATPVVEATAVGNTITATWASVEGAADYTVTCGATTITVVETTATFEGLEYDKEYTVSVVANPADASVNGASEAGVATATTESNGAAAVETITLDFKGHTNASGNSVGTLYDGDITVSSSGSWRTDKTDGRDCIYIGRTTSNEIRVEAKNGKVITKITMTAPVGYVIDLKAKENDGFSTTTFASVTTLEWSGECKSRVVFTPAGSSHTNVETITIEYR